MQKNTVIKIILVFVLMNLLALFFWLINSERINLKTDTIIDTISLVAKVSYTTNGIGYNLESNSLKIEVNPEDEKTAASEIPINYDSPSILENPSVSNSPSSNEAPNLSSQKTEPAAEAERKKKKTENPVGIFLTANLVAAAISDVIYIRTKRKMLKIK